jgi:hypothetical protein
MRRAAGIRCRVVPEFPAVGANATAIALPIAGQVPTKVVTTLPIATPCLWEVRPHE